ncbi:ribosomal protein S8 [Phakopsora pachyrhizi]|nr:ribosomal protein S8 [Phakopsora pachyrhizi]KAI8446605.1 ribosomal protein S8 [Phakopsora pachyrhizi]
MALRSRTIRPSLPFNLCSHLQNTSQRRLRQVMVPSSSLNLSILSVLLEHGFISNLTRGTVEGPDPKGFKDPELPIARRRLWVELKYRDEQPVLRKISLVSKPSVRVHMYRQQLLDYITRTGGLGLGEICLVRGGIWEARQAIRLMNSPDQAVEVICRASS